MNLVARLSLVLFQLLQCSGLNSSTLRIVQLSGGDETGYWSTDEWIPGLIRSSVALGIFPSSEAVRIWKRRFYAFLFHILRFIARTLGFSIRCSQNHHRRRPRQQFVCRSCSIQHGTPFASALECHRLPPQRSFGTARRHTFSPSHRPSTPVDRQASFSCCKIRLSNGIEGAGTFLRYAERRYTWADARTFDYSQP